MNLSNFLQSMLHCEGWNKSTNFSLANQDLTMRKELINTCLDAVSVSCGGEIVRNGCEPERCHGALCCWLRQAEPLHIKLKVCN